MRTLAEIAAELDTDKGPSGRNDYQGVFPGHDYTATYETLFAMMREQPITLLELGVWAGGSMRLWAEAFPRARMIHGLDVDMSRVDIGTLPGSVRLWHGSQTDADRLRYITNVAGGWFDLVIDDASHIEADQGTSLRLLWPHVRPGGLYIVEDVQSGKPPREWTTITGREPQLIWSKHPAVSNGNWNAGARSGVCAAVFRR